MHFDRQFSGLEFSMRLSVLQFHFSPHNSWWFDWKFSAHSHIQQQIDLSLSLDQFINCKKLNDLMQTSEYKMEIYAN